MPDTQALADRMTILLVEDDPARADLSRPMNGVCDYWLTWNHVPAVDAASRC